MFKTSSHFLSRPVIHTGKMATRDSQTLTLPDGRVLGFAEYGLPGGYPILYFHGFPTARLEGIATDAIGRRNGFRIIALDRPGFGLSTFQPGRQITDWPADVQACARYFELPRFAVLGVSGGGPYAVACAKALPRDILTAVGVFAGAPPWVAGRQYMSLPRRLMAMAATYWPSGLRLALTATVSIARWLVSTGPVTRRVDAWLESLRKDKKDDSEEQEDGEALTTAQRRDRLFRASFEAFAQGTEGTVLETQLLVSNDWGFKFEDVAYNKVQVWHGAKDTWAPATMIRYMAERLPHCEYKEFENDTHVTLSYRLEDMMLELVTKEMLAEESGEAKQRRVSSI
ncbi:Fc.00g058700.m01.CDS01 [Cosmosporella sp. VM-42]